MAKSLPRTIVAYWTCALLPATVSHASDGMLPQYQLHVAVDVKQQRLQVRGQLTIDATDIGLRPIGDQFSLSQMRLNSQAIEPDEVTFESPVNTLEFAYSGRWPASQESPLGISEQGSFLPAHGNWYPVLEGQPNFSYELTLSIDAGQKLISSGEIVSEQDSDTGYSATIISRQPMRAINLFAGPYQVDELDDHGTRIRTYFHEELAESANDYLQSTAEYLQDYRALIGPFPYSSFTIVSAPFGAGYGYQGLTYIGRRVLRLPFIRATSLRHEILHSYWGQGVFVDYPSGNWSEGLTTYLADYRTAEERGPDHARVMRHQWLRDFASLPAERDRPARSFVAKSHGASQVIGYHKVAMLFHALRREIGDAGFQRALQHFWRQHQFRTASWVDIQAAMEQQAGRELKDVFRQHLDSTGAPELTLDSAEVSIAADQWLVQFDLSQDEATNQLSIPVRITDVDGGETRQQVRLSNLTESASLTMSAEPIELAVDPDFDLFRRLGKGEAPPVLRDLQLNTDTKIVYASDDELTRTIAAALLRRPSAPAAESDDLTGNHPILVIGYSEELAKVLGQLDLGPAPAELAERGTARVWTQRTIDGQTVAIVDANDADAMRQLARPLPHYGRQAYLVFDGRRAAIKGTWPIQQQSLSRRFDRGTTNRK